jgi:hypothetical protein
MRIPAAASGDVRTSLRHEQISQHGQLPNDPDRDVAGPTEKDATSLLCPQDLPGWARGTCEASANASVQSRAKADAPYTKFLRREYCN